MTTGLLTDYFACGHAASSSWRAAAEAALAQCGTGVRGATLGLVYTTDAFADDYADILEFLRRRTGIAHWVGTVGLGVCASGREYLDEPAIALLCCSFTEDTFRVFSGLKTPRDVAQASVTTTSACGLGRASSAARICSRAWGSVSALMTNPAKPSTIGAISGSIKFRDGIG